MNDTALKIIKTLLIGLGITAALTIVIAMTEYSYYSVTVALVGAVLSTIFSKAYAIPFLKK